MGMDSIQGDDQAMAETQQLLELTRKLQCRLPAVEPTAEGEEAAEVQLLSRSAVVSAGIGPDGRPLALAPSEARPPSASPVRPPTAKELAPTDRPKVKHQSVTEAKNDEACNTLACKFAGCTRRF